MKVNSLPERGGEPISAVGELGRDGLEDRLWSIQDVARYLDIPVGTLYQWHHRGEGPPTLKLGRHLRYQPKSVRAWAGDQVA